MERTRATYPLLGGAAAELRELFAAPERIAAALDPAAVEQALDLARDVARAPRAAVRLVGAAAAWGDLPLDTASAREAGARELPGVGRVLVAPLTVPVAADGAGPARPFGVLAVGPTDGEADLAARLGGHAATLILERALARRADVDRLTGLLARPAFERTLPALNERITGGEPVAVALLDVDGLRELNARRGQDEGDEVLRTLAALMAAAAGAPERACRYGGDELVLVLAGERAAAAEAELARLGEGLRTVATGGRPPSFGAGLARAPEHGRDAATLLFQADQALARAKVEGPGRVVIWDEGLRGSRGRDRLAGVVTGAPARDYQNVQALLEVVASVSRLAPLKQTLTELVDRAVDVTGADRGLVLLREGAGWSIEAARGRGRADLPGEPRDLAFARSAAEEALSAGRAVHRVADEGPPSPSARQIGLTAVLCAPLLGEDVPPGVVYVDSRDASRFEPDQLAFFDALAAALVTALRNAVLYERLLERNARLRSDVAGRDEELARTRRLWAQRRARETTGDGYAGLVGASPAMRELFDLLESLEGTTVPVVIEGESGTGKELVARAIHERSPRREGPWVPVDCGAIPAALFESELFGHARGAFTGADIERPGLIEVAHGGTLFLDELGELPLEAQAKLLRALQEGEVRRVGERNPRPVDVRVVAATNRDLRRELAAGSFREDLFYRLAVFRLRVPPLRERSGDVPGLVRHLLVELGRPDAAVDPEAMRALVRARWPGNVRELRNTLERALALAGAGPIHSEHVQVEEAAGAGEEEGGLYDLPLKEARTLFTLRYARRVIDAAGGSVPAAAEQAGVSRQTLYRAIADGERLVGEREQSGDPAT